MKSLVVYFSRTGENSVRGEIEVVSKGYTEIVAEKIAQYTGGELYKLVPVEPYPDNYEECVKRVREEQETNKEVPFLNPKDNIDEYDIIYLGFPNWYRSYPRIVATFLKRYSFVGKTIRPFCTNEEGAFGMGELELRGSAKGAIIKAGFATRGVRAPECDEELLRWLNK